MYTALVIWRTKGQNTAKNKKSWPVFPTGTKKYSSKTVLQAVEKENLDSDKDKQV